MKICHKCGNRNFYDVGDKIECKNCGIDLSKEGKNYLYCGGGETKRKLLHDEYPWEFTHGD